MKKPLRFAVVGARRGRTFIREARRVGDRVKLVAICDTNPEMLADWADESEIRCYSDYQQVLEDPGIDAICIATPLTLHAKQAIAALEAGKHVLSEVPAAFEMEDTWALVEAVERTGLTYMLAENYCFMRDVLMVQEMVDRGVFGEITFAEGSYIHDCRYLYFTPEGDLTWRGKLREQFGGNTYPTHSLGPVCRWLGINRSDWLSTTSTWHSPAKSVMAYAKEKFPERLEYQDPSFWPHSDTVTTMVRTKKEILVQSRIDWASGRPHQMTLYGLQGSEAAFASPIAHGQPPMVWIKGRSRTDRNGMPHSWDSLYDYADEFEHPLWAKHFEEASGAGHGGGDYFVLREFAAAVEEGRPPLIDVYDAVTWSCIAPLSRVSIQQGNGVVEVPVYTRNEKFDALLNGAAGGRLEDH